MLICDTSGLLAFLDESDAYCAAVTGIIDADPGPLVVSPFVLAELDYLLLTRRGKPAELAALDELAGGAWELVEFGDADIRRARAIIDRYVDHDIGLTDASLVVLADRYRTDRVLTLDRRHFSVLRTLGGSRFSRLPEP